MVHTFFLLFSLSWHINPWHSHWNVSQSFGTDFGNFAMRNTIWNQYVCIYRTWLSPDKLELCSTAARTNSWTTAASKWLLLWAKCQIWHYVCTNNTSVRNAPKGLSPIKIDAFTNTHIYPYRQTFICCDDAFFHVIFIAYVNKYVIQRLCEFSPIQPIVCSIKYGSHSPLELNGVECTALPAYRFS